MCLYYKDEIIYVQAGWVVIRKKKKKKDSPTLLIADYVQNSLETLTTPSFSIFNRAAL